MSRGKYAKLREKYPEYISKDQLYKICRISKGSASYLLEHGIIPVIDTGKKTWRYKIALEDVIKYLRKRARKGSMIPHGAVVNHPSRPKLSFALRVPPGMEGEIRDYFEHIYETYPDVLTSADITEMTGLSFKTVWSLLKNGEIQSLRVGKAYYVPKETFLQFVATPRFIDIRSNSEGFKKVLEGFEVWKAVKSSQ